MPKLTILILKNEALVLKKRISSNFLSVNIHVCKFHVRKNWQLFKFFVFVIGIKIKLTIKKITCYDCEIA